MDPPTTVTLLKMLTEKWVSERSGLQGSDVRGMIGNFAQRDSQIRNATKTARPPRIEPSTAAETQA